MVATKRCAWGTCKNDARFPHLLVKNENGDPVSFIRFPAPKRWKESAEKRKRWIVACHRGDSFRCTKDSYICSLHFVGHNGPTPEHPDPISATASEEKVERLHRKRKVPKQRVLDMGMGQKKRRTAEKDVAMSLLDLQTSTIANATRTLEEILASESLLSLGNNTVPPPQEAQSQSFTADHCPSECPDKIQDGTAATSMDRSKNKPRSVSTQTNLQAVDINMYSDSTLKDSKSLRRYLFIASVDNPALTYHYTGLSKEYLKVLYNTIKIKARSLTMWSGFKKTNVKVATLKKKYYEQKQKWTKLTIWEQLIFTLVRLRRHPTLVMLCTTFGISLGSGSKIFITWVLFLAKESEFLLNFSTLSDMEGLPRPNVYKGAKYQSLRGVIDCTEMYVQKPSLPSSQRRTYSQYKSYNTFKLLVSLSPICHFNFVSKFYSGCISDKEIVRRSGFLDFIEPGDTIMADKGFNIQDLLAIRNSRLIAPPIMTKSKVSSHASTATRRVANSRVHVERIIRKLKCFGILRGVIPLTFKSYVTSIVRVCAAIVNLQPSLISFE